MNNYTNDKATQNMRGHIQALVKKYDIIQIASLTWDKSELSKISSFLTFYNVDPGLAIDLAKTDKYLDIITKYFDIDPENPPSLPVYASYEKKIKRLANQNGFEIIKSAFPIKEESHCKFLINFLELYRTNPKKALRAVYESKSKTKVLTTYLNKIGYSK